MFVSKRMTPNPVTIPPTMTVTEATNLMKSNNFRRVPVVDNGRLVGIVTDRDLRAVAPSPATTLSVFEINHLLAKMLVKEIMKSPVITIGADATIEEAALMMYTHKIGGLVVVDAAGAVAGIITETDIFKCLVDVMGLTEGRTRLTFEFDDKVGVLADVAAVFKELGINILSMATYNTEDGRAEMVIRADVKDAKVLVDRLTAIGYPVTHLVQIGND
ncbi:CBS and ACT domain-containing protein [Anaeroselena agilis]|uniref:CBS and ACT domain-containing protein n=1 Tax=Anaeroselena agilis TaxID=3063788 RepID=A0ABU3P2S5_9FIRM|nr:CBS and ACT domain-containing protein [Selenomonadales bacterium 4137-cl]